MKIRKRQFETNKSTRTSINIKKYSDLKLLQMQEDGVYTWWRYYIEETGKKLFSDYAYIREVHNV